MSEDRPSGESGPRFEERERRLAELLAEALDVPRERQWAFLRERCSDVEVVREAEALLAAKEGLGNFLSTPAIARVGLTSTQGLDDGSAAGDTDSRFGHFRIEELVGEGGMGRVYRGFQTEPVERQVAIKVVRSALAGPHTARRFANERHALARLNHPNIAQLYEASTTAGGRPYFVMEYVDGPPIHEYCDRWRLGLAERLELFLEVCRGVEHAHRRQLLHRDLKPSNLLVATADGVPVPKVIDFGISRALDDSGDESTGTGPLAFGTPQYMSPEALRPSPGGDLDTRTDVYSLGVVLYELLAGSRPFAGTGSDLVDLYRRLEDGPPTPPSERIRGLAPGELEEISHRRACRPRTLARRLAGDLDAVVLKTLAFDREERYGSVSELAADLDRVLHHRSVTVRDAPWPERALRLVRRHAAASVAVAVAVALLTAAVALATLALVRGARAEAEAQREAEATRQALAFVVDLFEAASPGQAQDQDLNAQELLDLGRERIRGLDLPPLERARLLEMLAETNLRLERFDQAREAAVTAYSLRRSELGDDAPELEASASLLRRIDSAERAHAESTG